MKYDQELYQELRQRVFLMDTKQFTFQEEDVYTLYSYILKHMECFCHVLYYTYLLHYGQKPVRNLLESKSQSDLETFFLQDIKFGYFVVTSYLELFSIKYDTSKEDLYLSYYHEAVGRSKTNQLLKKAIYQVYLDGQERYSDSFQGFLCVQKLIVEHTDTFVSLPKVGLSLDTFYDLEPVLATLLLQESLHIIEQQHLQSNAFYQDLYQYLLVHQNDTHLPDHPAYLWQILSIFVHCLEQQDFTEEKRLFFIEN